MSFRKSVALATCLLFCSAGVFAEEELSDPDKEVKEKAEEELTDTEKQAKGKAEEGKGDDLTQFGFGPAFYVISYDEEVLGDAKDVRIKGDGAINSSGSKYSTSIGLEVHYDFSFGNYSKCIKNSCDNSDDWTSSSGHILSPFLGLYDLDNGINGIAAGIIYGYWRGDGNFENKTTLNVGLGWTVHKDRLVLAEDLAEGVVPPTALGVEDYTERKDVEGLTLMISANIKF